MRINSVLIKGITRRDKLSIVISHSIEEVQNKGNKAYDCNEIKVPVLAGYPEIVSAIISDRYTQSEENALINNKLADPTTEHLQEFEDYQSYRNYSKQLAKAILRSKQEWMELTIPEIDEIAKNVLDIDLRVPEYDDLNKEPKVDAILSQMKA